MVDTRDGIRQRIAARTEARFTGPETDGQQSDRHERNLAHGVLWGASIGLAIGAGIGVAMDNLAWGIGIGLSMGTGIGIALGSVLGKKHAVNGK